VERLALLPALHTAALTGPSSQHRLLKTPAIYKPSVIAKTKCLFLPGFEGGTLVFYV
jgi:hypothetical protein